MNKYYCKELDCNNKITYKTWKYSSGRCSSCSHKDKRNSMFGKYHTIDTKRKMRLKKLGKKHPNTIKQNENISKALKGRKITWADKIAKAHKGKKHSITTRRKLIKILKKARKNGLNLTKIVNHHIYLKENSKETTKLTRKKHRQLHSRAYNYIYGKYGKKGIDNYLKWFFKNYGK